MSITSISSISSFQASAAFAYWQQRRNRLGHEDFLKSIFEISLDPEKLFSHLKTDRDWSHSKLAAFLDKLEQKKSMGLHFTWPLEPDYPTHFYALTDPPPFLSYYGSPIWTTHPGLAVVGSRNPSEFSMDWMQIELGESLQKFKGRVYTVSGGARGIDQICHRLCLRLNVPTVVVSPSGLEQLYPPSLGDLKDFIVQSGGALLSEHLPSQKVFKSHFLPRNRLIAALGFSSLIVDARKRSGTYLTARHTLELGHPVFVVPCHPMDPNGQGSLELLFEGATMVRNAKDLNTYIDSEIIKFATGSV